jgi:cell wall-associated NlpC family hydrolase
MLKLIKNLPSAILIVVFGFVSISIIFTCSQNIKVKTEINSIALRPGHVSQINSTTVNYAKVAAVPMPAYVTKERIIASTNALSSRGAVPPIITAVPTETIGIITDDNVNVRDYPDLYTSQVIDCLKKDVKVYIKSQCDDWYKVNTSDKVIGWVNKGLIEISTLRTLIPTEKPKERPKEVIPLGKQITDYAKKFLGVKYVWGGSSPSGFDCSGYVKYVYSKFGIYLERVAADQARQGTKVKIANLKYGDLVFFDTNGGHSYINHVGIYIGDGELIEASTTSRKIKINEMAGYYNRNFMTARRFF